MNLREFENEQEQPISQAKLTGIAVEAYKQIYSELLDKEYKRMIGLGIDAAEAKEIIEKKWRKFSEEAADHGHHCVDNGQGHSGNNGSRQSHPSAESGARSVPLISQIIRAIESFIRSLKTKEQRYALAIFLSALLPMVIHLLIYAVDGGKLTRLDRCLDLNRECYYAFSQTIFLINAATLSISLLGVWWAHRWHHHYRAARQWLREGKTILTPPIFEKPPFSYEGDIFAVEKTGDGLNRLVRWSGKAWESTDAPWSIRWAGSEISPEALAKVGIASPIKDFLEPPFEYEGDIWAVEKSGEVVRWDKGGWVSTTALPSLATRGRPLSASALAFNGIII